MIYIPLLISVPFVAIAILFVKGHLKIVENWWCPFEHEKKEAYKDSSIDYSCWHIDDKERSRLHEDDKENPIWNEDAQNKDQNPIS